MLADRGLAADEVAEVARQRAMRSSAFFYVDTLEYLRRGGRIGHRQALVGTALAVKPLLHLQDGAIQLLEKVRTSSRAVARLEDLAVQRAMAKDPDDRFESMNDFCVELEACLAELGGRDGEGATLIVPPPRRPPRAARAPRRGRRVPVTPLLILLAGAVMAVGAYLLLEDDSRVPLVPREAAAAPVQLQGLDAFDPEGDGSEHGEDARFATDRNSGTAWGTETYRNFQKGGVGLVLQAPSPVALSKLTVRSMGSEFDAQIKAGNSPTGGFTAVSGAFQPVLALGRVDPRTGRTKGRGSREPRPFCFSRVAQPRRKMRSSPARRRWRSSASSISRSRSAG